VAVTQASGGPPPAGSAESRVPRPRRWERGYGCSAGGRASIVVIVTLPQIQQASPALVESVERSCATDSEELPESCQPLKHERR